MLNHLLYDIFLWTYDLKIFLGEGKNYSSTEKLFILLLHIYVSLCVLYVCPCLWMSIYIVYMCLSVKECAADFFWSCNSPHGVLCMCRCYWKPRVHGFVTLLCALNDASAAIQAQSVVPWLCLKAQMGLRHACPGSLRPQESIRETQK